MLSSYIKLTITSSVSTECNNLVVHISKHTHAYSMQILLLTMRYVNDVYTHYGYEQQNVSLLNFVRGIFYSL